MRSSVWCSAVVLLVAVACDGGAVPDDGGARGDGAAPDATASDGGRRDGGGASDAGPRDEVPASLVGPLGAFCDLLDRCPELYPIGARDRAECVDILYWLFTCERLDDGTRRVDISITEEEARQCADALDALSCADVACVERGDCPEMDACGPLFARFGSDDDDEDRVPDGERCYFNSTARCGEGSFCASPGYDATSEAVTCSVCAPRLPAGAACDATRTDPYALVQCAPGLVCLGGPTGGACARPLADGEPCRSSSECADGFCSHATPGAPVCSDGGRIGDPCTARDDCRWEVLGADYVTCVEGTCATPLRPGDACTSNDACRSFECAPDGRCGTPDGSSCLSSYECRSTYCRDRVCTARAPLGSACDEGDACLSDVCDPATMRCVAAPPPSGLGEACVEDDDCEEDLQCAGTCYRPCPPDGCGAGELCDTRGDLFTCRPLLTNGESCSADDECESDFCSDDAEVCRTRPSIGDPCSAPSDCYPAGYCDGGTCAARLGPDASCSALDSCLEPYVCLDGTCRLISLSCEPGSVGELCTYLRFCDASSFCDYAGGVRCVPRLGEGESCIAALDQCEAGLYCRDGACAARVAEGAPCAEGDLCVEGTVCVSGSCARGPGGGRCEEDADCPSGTYCDDDEICLPFRGLDEECDEPFDDFCAPGLYCDDSRHCREPPGVGETCTSDSGCAAGAWCDRFDGWICAPRVPLGDPCDTTRDSCIEGSYCAWSGSEYACTAGTANGGACRDFEDETCASGSCVEDLCSSTPECVLP